MKMFIPAVGYRIKLTNDWKFKLYAEHRNDTLLKQFVADIDSVIVSEEDRYVARSYDKGLRYIDCTLPAGCVLEVDRVYVRTDSKTAEKDDDCDSLTFKVIEHPTFNAKKKIRFWSKLQCVNSIEYELPEDHAAGKLEAIARSKAPKKLTPRTAADIVSRGFDSVSHAYRRGSRPKKPSWLTKQLLSQCASIKVEYDRLFVPHETKKAVECAKKARKDLEASLTSGTLTIPIAFAGKIKTIEDLETYMPNSGWTSNIKKRTPRIYDQDYIIRYTILHTFGSSKSSSSSHALPIGGRRRVYRPAKPYEYHNSSIEQDPDVTHLWIAIESDPTDTEIIKVEAGFDDVSNGIAV